MDCPVADAFFHNLLARLLVEFPGNKFDGDFLKHLPPGHPSRDFSFRRRGLIAGLLCDRGELIREWQRGDGLLRVELASRCASEGQRERRRGMGGCLGRAFTFGIAPVAVTLRGAAFVKTLLDGNASLVDAGCKARPEVPRIGVGLKAGLFV